MRDNQSPTIDLALLIVAETSCFDDLAIMDEDAMALLSGRCTKLVSRINGEANEITIKFAATGGREFRLLGLALPLDLG